MGDPWAWHGHVAARVAGWVEKRETIPDDQRDTYFDAERWYHVPDEVRDTINAGTKLGGIPYWGNMGPHDHRPSPWRLAVQMVDDHFFWGRMPEGLPQRSDESGQPFANHVWPWSAEDGEGIDCRWANFATGLGYVYLNDEDDPPACYFTWQRLI